MVKTFAFPQRKPQSLKDFGRDSGCMYQGATNQSPMLPKAPHIILAYLSPYSHLHTVRNFQVRALKFSFCQDKECNRIPITARGCHLVGLIHQTITEVIVETIFL